MPNHSSTLERLSAPQRQRYTNYSNIYFRYIALSLLAVLVLNGNLAGIILQYKAFNLMHGYIGMVAALLTYMSLQEAELISRGKWLNRIYRPVGLIITLVAALVLLVHQRLLSSGITHYWVSSVFPYPGAAVCYL